MCSWLGFVSVRSLKADTMSYCHGAFQASVHSRRDAQPANRGLIKLGASHCGQAQGSSHAHVLEPLTSCSACDQALGLALVRQARFTVHRPIINMSW